MREQIDVANLVSSRDRDVLVLEPVAGTHLDDRDGFWQRHSRYDPFAGARSSTSGAPPVTSWPSFTSTVPTTPANDASIRCSIFIASSTMQQRVFLDGVARSHRDLHDLPGHRRGDAAIADAGCRRQSARLCVGVRRPNAISLCKCSAAERCDDHAGADGRNSPSMSPESASARHRARGPHAESARAGCNPNRNRRRRRRAKERRCYASRRAIS